MALISALVALKMHRIINKHSVLDSLRHLGAQCHSPIKVTQLMSETSSKCSLDKLYSLALFNTLAFLLTLKASLGKILIKTLKIITDRQR